MHPPSRHGKTYLPTSPRPGLALLLLGSWNFASTAFALPGFASPSGQPCTACQATQTRLTDDRLTPRAGLAAEDRQNWAPLEMMISQASFTLTGNPSLAGAPHPYGDQRHEWDVIAGAAPCTWIAPRNSWDAMPVWGFPYPAADSRPAGRNPAAGTPWTDDSNPRWRVALQSELERHFLQIGTYGSSAEESPGATDHVADTAAGMTYRFVIDPTNGSGDTLSAHAILIHQVQPADSGYSPIGYDRLHMLDSFRADASYSFSATVTPSIEYFRTGDESEVTRYGWPGSRPNSAGVVASVAWLPWAQSDNPVQSLNLRFAAQYVAYTAVSATARGSAGSNALYLSLWGALHF